MSKKIKALEIEALRTAVKGVRDYVLVEPLKVDASTDFTFRKNLRARKIRAMIVKNTYAKKVFDEMGIAVDTWAGPTLLCWGGASIKELSTTVDDQVRVARKDPKSPERYKIKTAVADGLVVSFDLAKTMPTREEAIGEVIAALCGPGSSIAAALTGPATQLAGILKAIEEKGPTGGEAPPPAEAAPSAEAPPATARGAPSGAARPRGALGAARGARRPRGGFPRHRSGAAPPASAPPATS
jgi:ribosomal protein L10